MAEKMPSSWNKHHTLYYRRNYMQRPITRAWRNHPAMIVPIDVIAHADLHRDLGPVDTIATDDLASFALAYCVSIQREVASSYEAFSSVSDELRSLYRRRRSSQIGREALKFSDHFNAQLEYMTEVPVLGTPLPVWDRVTKQYEYPLAS